MHAWGVRGPSEAPPSPLPAPFAHPPLRQVRHPQPKMEGTGAHLGRFLCARSSGPALWASFTRRWARTSSPSSWPPSRPCQTSRLVREWAWTRAGRGSTGHGKTMAPGHGPSASERARAAAPSCVRRLAGAQERSTGSHRFRQKGGNIASTGRHRSDSYFVRVFLRLPTRATRVPTYLCTVTHLPPTPRDNATFLYHRSL